MIKSTLLELHDRDPLGIYRTLPAFLRPMGPDMGGGETLVGWTPGRRISEVVRNMDCHRNLRSLSMERDKNNRHDRLRWIQKLPFGPLGFDIDDRYQ